MTNFDLSVKDWRGRIIGYRCIDCGGVFSSMWDNICNGCRESERRHQELVAAIRTAGEKKDGSQKPK
jgi:predicted  nucleic acid-binding Zn-ribbon protein